MDGSLLDKPTRGRPVLPGPAPPRSTAVRRPAPTRPCYVLVLESTGEKQFSHQTCLAWNWLGKTRRHRTISQQPGTNSDGNACLKPVGNCLTTSLRPGILYPCAICTGYAKVHVFEKTCNIYFYRSGYRRRGFVLWQNRSAPPCLAPTVPLPSLDVPHCALPQIFFLGTRIAN